MHYLTALHCTTRRQANSWATGLGRGRVRVAEAYTGVSGYGGECSSNLRDYAKFLRAFIRRGQGANGARIMSEQMWAMMLTPTIDDDDAISALPMFPYTALLPRYTGGEFSPESRWKWGYSGRYVIRSHGKKER